MINFIYNFSGTERFEELHIKLKLHLFVKKKISIVVISELREMLLQNEIYKYIAYN